MMLGAGAAAPRRAFATVIKHGKKGGRRTRVRPAGGALPKVLGDAESTSRPKLRAAAHGGGAAARALPAGGGAGTASAIKPQRQFIGWRATGRKLAAGGAVVAVVATGGAAYMYLLDPNPLMAADPHYPGGAVGVSPAAPQQAERPAAEGLATDGVAETGAAAAATATATAGESAFARARDSVNPLHNRQEAQQTTGETAAAVAAAAIGVINSTVGDEPDTAAAAVAPSAAAEGLLSAQQVQQQLSALEEALVAPVAKLLRAAEVRTVEDHSALLAAAEATRAAQGQQWKGEHAAERERALATVGEEEAGAVGELRARHSTMEQGLKLAAEEAHGGWSYDEAARIFAQNTAGSVGRLRALQVHIRIPAVNSLSKIPAVDLLRQRRRWRCRRRR